MITKCHCTYFPSLQSDATEDTCTNCYFILLFHEEGNIKILSRSEKVWSVCVDRLVMRGGPNANETAYIYLRKCLNHMNLS